jgi:hypothetical protein
VKLQVYQVAQTECTPTEAYSCAVVNYDGYPSDSAGILPETCGNEGHHKDSVRGFRTYNGLVTYAPGPGGLTRGPSTPQVTSFVLHGVHMYSFYSYMFHCCSVDFKPNIPVSSTTPLAVAEQKTKWHGTRHTCNSTHHAPFLASTQYSGGSGFQCVEGSNSSFYSIDKCLWFTG